MRKNQVSQWMIEYDLAEVYRIGGKNDLKVREKKEEGDVKRGKRF